MAYDPNYPLIALYAEEIIPSHLLGPRIYFKRQWEKCVSVYFILFYLFILFLRFAIHITNQIGSGFRK